MALVAVANVLQPATPQRRSTVAAHATLAARHFADFVSRRDAVDPTSLVADGSLPTWKIRMLYDGGCPLCMREVEVLRKRSDDGGPDGAWKGAIDFVDIDSADYDAALNAGIGYRKAMESIHAIRADGTVLCGVPVFAELYEAVGLGWVYAPTKITAIGGWAQSLYDFWAQRRLAVTFRPDDLESLVARRRGTAAEVASCRIVGGGCGAGEEPAVAADGAEEREKQPAA